ncbi:MAG: thiol oxidoreductase [Saprospiraceae bacterium]|nr:thiol oxidoreductase [Saprospiraceae bacterium]
MKSNFTITCLCLFYIFTLFSCEKLFPEAPLADSVMDAPLDGLTELQNRIFLDGAEEFDEVYTQETGLGPIFVGASCASCHNADNRGTLSTILTRFGQIDSTGNKFMHLGGPQLQHFALPGYDVEKIPSGASSSKLIAPIISGTGFIELVPESDILAMSDPNDSNNDGISGTINWNQIPNWVKPNDNSITKDGKYICRFGRKAGTYNLHQQIVQAFNQDIGITTTFMPNNPINYLTGTNPAVDSDIDITDESLNATVFYTQVLQTPFQRNALDPEVIKGKEIFNSIQCSACHVEKLKTGFSVVDALSFKEFYPYSDLLLHDMGSELNDNYTEGSALTSEWRTAPLWGLGLAKDVQGGKYFLMHDGRARSIEEAILLHKGEGLNSSDKFKTLQDSEKNQLIKFLESL